MTVGSLFTGIGGLDLGLERAGMRVIWQCECDHYARRVLAKHWPGVPCYEDVRDVRAVDVVRPDLLCGGFPCQDISLAGNGAGLDGERSGLWHEFARCIGELRPRYVLVENVAALLGRGLDRVLGRLAALGYDAEWHCIPAASVGAPHRRDRLFIVAYANSVGCERARAGELGQDALADRRHNIGRLGQGVADAPRDGRVTRPPCDPEKEPRGREPGRSGVGTDVRHTDSSRLAFRQGFTGDSLAQFATTVGADWWESEPAVGRVADGVPRRVDRLRCLGNAVVPQVAEYIGRCIMAADAEVAP